MIIKYKTKLAEHQFNSQYQSKWKYPEAVRKKLLSTENYIQNANSLSDIVRYPPFRFHLLKGKRKGEWSISLGNTGFRVTIIPCDNNGRELLSGDIIGQCKSIEIVTITEVSNHYE